MRKYILQFLMVPLVLLSQISIVLAQQRTLEEYIQIATDNSPLLTDLSNQLLINKADSALIRANFKPQLGFNSTGTYAPVVRGFGYDEALSNGRTFSALVTVNQSVLGKSRINNQLQGLKVLTDSVRNAAKLTQQDIRRTIISQYITAYAGQLQLEFDRQVYRLIAEEEIILKKLTQKSVYKQSDYLAFLVTLQQQGLQLKQDEIALMNNVASLNYLSGIVSTDSVKLAEPKLNVAASANQPKSIFFKQYSLDSLRIQNSRSLIDLNYRPQLGAYADAGYNSSFIEQPYKNFGTSVGFTLLVPIYDGHQKKLQYRKLDLEERTRIAYKDYNARQYNQQLLQLKQQLNESESLFTKINEQFNYTKTLISVNGKLLQTGDITIADYILALRNYLDTQNSLRQTTTTRLDLINQLNYWNQ